MSILYKVSVTVEATLAATDATSAITKLAECVKDIPINSALNDDLHWPPVVTDVHATQLPADRDI